MQVLQVHAAQLQQALLLRKFQKRSAAILQAVLSLQAATAVDDRTACLACGCCCYCPVLLLLT
jgi:hypothetical protein